MPPQAKPYIFHGMTTSLCADCLTAVPTKIIIQDGAVYLVKRCPEHGEQRDLLEEDAGFFLRQTEYDKPGTYSATQTPVGRGCPYDCGLCPDHEQHTCIALLEVTEQCDLHCPVCFADAGHGAMLDLPTIARMLDLFQESEGGQAEILQISGGEPTTHPQILEIIALAREKRIKFVMLNTNGMRLAQDPAFVRALAQFRGGFEVYLQFDGFSEETYQRLRGLPLLEMKQQAIANLHAHDIPVTLVSTIQAGVNEHEIGRIVEYGIRTPGIRGVNFQPLAYFGRLPADLPARRITRTGILQRLEAQTSGMIMRQDFIPLPCDVDRVAITYLYRQGESFVPLTRNAKIKDYLPLVQNTFAFDAGDILKQLAEGLLTGQQVCRCMSFLKDFMPVAPIGRNLQWKEGKVRYAIENTFRISVTSFLDRYTFDMKSMKKECVHVLTPDLRKIPFSAYNLIHREALCAHV